MRELNQRCLTRINASLASTSLPAVAAVAATNAVSQGFAPGVDNAIADNTIHVGGAKAGRLLSTKISAKRDRVDIVLDSATPVQGYLHYDHGVATDIIDAIALYNIARLCGVQ